MTLLTKIVTGIFGKKSEKDLRILRPIIEDINSSYDSLKNLSELDLKKLIENYKNELQTKVSDARTNYKEEGLKSEDLEDAINQVEKESAPIFDYNDLDGITLNYNNLTQYIGKTDYSLRSKNDMNKILIEYNKIQKILCFL